MQQQQPAAADLGSASASKRLRDSQGDRSGPTSNVSTEKSNDFSSGEGSNPFSHSLANFDRLLASPAPRPANVLFDGPNDPAVAWLRDVVALPAINRPDVYEIGNQPIQPDPSVASVVLPGPWKTLLYNLYNELHLEAHGIATGLSKLHLVIYNQNLGKPFGKFTVKDPTDPGLYAASSNETSVFETKVHAINTKYIYDTNQAAIDALRRVLQVRVPNLAQLFIHHLRHLVGMVTELVSTMAPALIDLKAIRKLFLGYERLWSQLASLLECKFAAIKAKAIAKASKRLAAGEMVQRAHDDLMDTEVNQETIKSLVKTLVTQELNNNNNNKSAGKSKGKQSASSAAPPPAKAGPVKQSAKKTTSGSKASSKAKAKKSNKSAPPKTAGPNARDQGNLGLGQRPPAQAKKGNPSSHVHLTNKKTGSKGSGKKQ